MANYRYRCAAEWTGAANGPTDQMRFDRSIQVTFTGRPALDLSSPPEFQGSAERVSPEELFVASLATCQMLTYLALAARKGIVVTGYHDEAEGELALKDGHLRFTNVTLHPAITIASGADQQAAQALIEHAHRDCFIGNSVTSHVAIEPQPIRVQ
jgi:organic hydroperoxide reductase OsmC/OhrA